MGSTAGTDGRITKKNPQTQKGQESEGEEYPSPFSLYSVGEKMGINSLI